VPSIALANIPHSSNSVRSSTQGLPEKDKQDVKADILDSLENPPRKVSFEIMNDCLQNDIVHFLCIKQDVEKNLAVWF